MHSIAQPAGNFTDKKLWRFFPAPLDGLYNSRDGFFVLVQQICTPSIHLPPNHTSGILR